ncbi:MAG: UDP-4-amino-4,6-dideoxy-N-acetyl-beta-L-altrosamine transaminase [Candidatus Hydrogenedentes bacterium]|nr:UDP-4-amino-4,6-dideoxy-N-acetyl-beta-L-altrosamine transaminase [Candidatus Hydrogenedentota bacterium]
MPERLAIDGGTPVRRRLLPYSHQQIDIRDIAAVVEVLRSEWLTTGPAVESYEKRFAEFVGAKHAVAVSSGTAALHAAAFTAGIGPGDDVVTSPITFAATANCVLYCGGRPVFADIQPDTGNFDPAALECFIAPQTKAILAVDFAGQPADHEEIRDLAARRGLTVIEDAAHALGAQYKSRKVGALARMTAFSTHPVKPITTGEGGVITTDEDALAQRLRAFRNHGICRDATARAREGDWFYEMNELGFNYRLPDILCAIGKSQLEKAETWRERRAAIAAHYDEALSNIPAIAPLTQHSDRVSAWHLYVIQLRLERLRVDRKNVFRALRAEGIGVNVHYIPVYWHPYYQELGYKRGQCPIAEAFYERALTLPLWAGMTDEDANDVITAVNKVITAYRSDH